MEKNILEITNVEFIKTNSEKVIARADINFRGFTLKGFKILCNEHGKQYVTPPSYKAGPFWRPLFRTDSPGDWEYICKEVLDRFGNKEVEDSLKERTI